MPFKGFGLGKDLFHQLDKEHELLDRDFRLFAEECDQMQGVQVMMPADDAWGGFGSEYIAALRDEYSKVAIVTWGLEGGDKVPRVSLLDSSSSILLSSPLTFFFFYPKLFLFFYFIYYSLLFDRRMAIYTEAGYQSYKNESA